MSLIRSKKPYFILAVLVIIGGSAGGYKIYRDKTSVEAVAYKEETVQKGNIKVEYTVDGTVELPLSYLDFPSEAKIKDIYFKVGDSFKAGDTVAKQDDTDLVDAVGKAKLAYDKAQINYNDAVMKKQTESSDLESQELNAKQQIRGQEQKIADVESQIHTAKQNIEKMKLTPDEYAAIDIENAERELESLNRQYKNEKETLAIYQRDLKLIVPEKDSSLELAKISIQEAKMSYETAKSKLMDVNLIATEDGKIMSITKKIGETAAEIASGEGATDKSFITYMATNKPYVVTVKIPEFDLKNIQIGQKAEVLVEGYSEERIVGKVSIISDIPETDSNQVVTYEAVIELDEKPDGLKQGMNAVVSLISKEVKDVITVSNTNVYFEDGKQYVNVKDELGNIEKREIATGFSDGTTTEVKKGLEPSEKVISKLQVQSKEKTASKEKVTAQ